MWDITADMESFNHLPGGGNVLWLDGSVTFLRTREWAGVNLPYRPDGLEFDHPGLDTPMIPDPAQQ